MGTVTFYTRSHKKEWHEARLLANASSRTDIANGNRPPRWSEIHLYVTPYGRYLCQVIGRSLVPEEETRYGLVRANSIGDMIDALGYGWLAKQVYDAAGIDHAVSLDNSQPAMHAPLWGLKQENAPDLMFHGYKLDAVTSQDDRRADRIRWTEIHLYRTVGGQLVCDVQGCSMVAGEITRRQVHVGDSPLDLAEKLGRGRLANQLYLNMGWSIGKANIPHYRMLQNYAA